MIKTKITKKRIKDHFTYSVWKYVILVIVGVFGWNLIYTTTAYRPPKEKKVDVYFVTTSIDYDTLELFTEMTTPVFEDMEELNFFSIGMNTDDDYYATLQLTTYVGAQEGDIYIMSRDRFRSFAYSGLFLPLDEAFDTGAIDLRGIDASGTYLTTEEGMSGLYAVPAKSLYGLMEYGIDNRDLYIGVVAYSKNIDNAYKMVDWFIEAMQTERPEWLDALEERESQASPAPTDDVLPSY